jgi:hypothetical protein
MLASLIMVILTNVRVLSAGAIRQRQEAALSRLPVAGSAPEPRSVFVVPHPQDELFQFHRNYPFHPRNLGGLKVLDVFAPGLVASSEWRSRVDRRLALARDSGEAVYVSSRLLARKPAPDWDWIEGDDSRVTWRALHEHFARFEYQEAVRPGEEFLLLVRADGGPPPR